MKRSLWAPLAVVVALFLMVGGADAATITFDELPFQPVNGLSFNGVTFNFSVGGSPSTDANFNSGGPGTVTFVQDPSLEGTTAGTLELVFATPTPVLEFGVALNTFEPLSPGFGALLFDSVGTLLGGISTVDTNPLVDFSEGLFQYSGTPLGSAQVLFNTSSATRFALDNLKFNVPAAIPTPSTLLLLGGGLIGMVGFGRKKFRK